MSVPTDVGQEEQIKDEDVLKPSAVAETYWHRAHQDLSAWTRELDVRPCKEKF